MKLVILDGYCLNPGDLSWAGLEALGELTVYDRTPLDDEDEIGGRGRAFPPPAPVLPISNCSGRSGPLTPAPYR